jgi:hypothetical protein
MLVPAVALCKVEERTMLALTKQDGKKIIRELKKRSRADWERDAHEAAEAMKAIREDRRVREADLRRQATI